MAITSEVVSLQSDHEFRSYVALNFLMAADWVLNGNFPANVATGSEKNAVSKYASDCFIGAANINSQVLTILAQTAIQDQINGAGGLAGAYSIMQAQARANLKNIAGVKPSYAE